MIAAVNASLIGVPHNTLTVILNLNYGLSTFNVLTTLSRSIIVRNMAFAEDIMLACIK